MADDLLGYFLRNPALHGKGQNAITGIDGSNGNENETSTVLALTKIAPVPGCLEIINLHDSLAVADRRLHGLTRWATWRYSRPGEVSLSRRRVWRRLCRCGTVKMSYAADVPGLAVAHFAIDPEHYGAIAGDDGFFGIEVGVGVVGEPSAPEVNDGGFAVDAETVGAGEVSSKTVSSVKNSARASASWRLKASLKLLIAVRVDCSADGMFCGLMGTSRSWRLRRNLGTALRHTISARDGDWQSALFDLLRRLY